MSEPAGCCAAAAVRSLPFRNSKSSSERPRIPSSAAAAAAESEEEAARESRCGRRPSGGV